MNLEKLIEAARTITDKNSSFKEFTESLKLVSTATGYTTANLDIANAIESSSKSVIVADRQIGKTNTAIQVAMKHVLSKPKSVVTIITPTYSMSKSIFSRMFEMFSGIPLVTNSVNVSAIKLYNGSEVRLITMSTHMRGYSFSDSDLIIVDEIFSYSNTESSTMSELMSFLATTKARVAIISSPVDEYRLNQLSSFSKHNIATAP
jgi:hypothetical protein